MVTIGNSTTDRLPVSRCFRGRGRGWPGRADGEDSAGDEGRLVGQQERDGPCDVEGPADVPDRVQGDHMLVGSGICAPVLLVPGGRDRAQGDGYDADACGPWSTAAARVSPSAVA